MMLLCCFLLWLVALLAMDVAASCRRPIDAGPSPARMTGPLYWE